MVISPQEMEPIIQEFYLDFKLADVYEIIRVGSSEGDKDLTVDTILNTIKTPKILAVIDYGQYTFAYDVDSRVLFVGYSAEIYNDL